MSTVLISELHLRDRFHRAFLVAMATLGQMPFLEHLEELRQRLIKCLIALAAGTVVGFVYTALIIEFLGRPAAASGIRLVAIDATEVFSLYFKVALATGICLAAPVSGKCGASSSLHFTSTKSATRVLSSSPPPFVLLRA
jgi:Sec-independent protein translocase protein (TatC)